jgi:hypothetical protein
MPAPRIWPPAAVDPGALLIKGSMSLVEID